MITELINLAVVFFLGILYMALYAKILNNFFRSIMYPKNTAALMLFSAGLFSAGINLYEISEVSSAAFHFFSQRGEMVKAIGYYGMFFVGMWLFSFVFFRVSFYLVDLISPENEKVELAKNNLEIAALHSLILLSLSLVVSPALVAVATKCIPYPEMPF
jgi:hypothetical protein